MALEYKDLKELALHAVRGTAPANYSKETVNEAFVKALNDMFPSGRNRRINDFERNKYEIYDLYMDIADEVLPKRVMEQMGRFAEVKHVGQGERAVFVRKTGRTRAKLFLTQVALSGVYETFRLDKETYTIGMSADGIAFTIDFVRLLDGAESIAESFAVMNEAFLEHIFKEVQRALVAAATDLKNLSKDTNVITNAGFKAEDMVKLLNIARAYSGGGVAIFATPEFIAAMGPDAIVPGGTGYLGLYSPDDIDAIHKNGIVQVFRGAPIIPIQQSFVDENNKQTWINPQYAYVLPTGQEKVVKVAFEGGMQVYDYTNRDNSIEVHAYQMMGTAITSYHNWGIYQNTDVEDTSIA